jgi:hypothetical protein
MTAAGIDGTDTRLSDLDVDFERQAARTGEESRGESK